MKTPLLVGAVMVTLGTLDLVQQNPELTNYLTEAGGVMWTNLMRTNGWALRSFMQFKIYALSLFPSFTHTFRYHVCITYTHKSCLPFTLKSHIQPINTYCTQSYAIFYIHLKWRMLKTQDSQNRQFSKADTYINLKLSISELSHIIFKLHDHIKFHPMIQSYLQHAYCRDPLFTHKELTDWFKVCSHIASYRKDALIMGMLSDLCLLKHSVPSKWGP